MILSVWFGLTLKIIFPPFPNDNTAYGKRMTFLSILLRRGKRRQKLFFPVVEFRSMVVTENSTQHRWRQRNLTNVSKCYRFLCEFEKLIWSMHGTMVAVAGGYDVRNYCLVTILVGDDSDTHSMRLPIPEVYWVDERTIKLIFLILIKSKTYFSNKFFCLFGCIVSQCS